MSSTPVGYISLEQRLRHSVSQWEALKSQFACDLRVACPGVVQKFNAGEQTVDVDLAITERIVQNFQSVDKEFPTLIHVPLVLPRAGGFLLTLPVAPGDECLVIFADMCYDAWWQSGGLKNRQIDLRRHDLSDGFAILGPWSQKRLVTNYSTESAQLRSDDGTCKVEIANGQVNITAPAISLTGTVTINGKLYTAHTHSGVQTGSGVTGGIVP